MKALFKKIIFSILSWCARVRLMRLRRSGLQIIGITGSIGKTTCKEAVAHVLSEQLRVLKSDKSYNTELGLPLTILELKSEFSSPIGWTKNIAMAVWRGYIDRRVFDVAVLEMGVDKPGDMDVLLSMVTPDIAIFTGVHPVHLAPGQFNSIDEIFQEKAKLVKAVPATGTAILNHDDERCARLGAEMGVTKGSPKVIMFGLNDKAKLSADHVKGEWGEVHFTAHYGEVAGEIQVPILGAQHVGSLLPAIGCGLIFGMYMPDISDRLLTFRLPPGRLSLIEGMSDSWIIDSSYNASPDAVKAAIETLRELASLRPPITRRVFIFGNMNELGTASESKHRQIASYLSGAIDTLVTVGDQAKFCAEEATTRSLLPKEQIHSFLTTDEAVAFTTTFIQSGDLILVKGSQNKVRLERLVKAIMKDPERASELLARQDWKS